MRKKTTVEVLDYLKIDAELESEIGLDPDIGLSTSGRRRRSKVFYAIDETVDLKSIEDLYKRYRRGKVGDESTGAR